MGKVTVFLPYFTLTIFICFTLAKDLINDVVTSGPVEKKEKGELVIKEILLGEAWKPYNY
jgi:hypothetical protein